MVARVPCWGLALAVARPPIPAQSSVTLTPARSCSQGARRWTPEEDRLLRDAKRKDPATITYAELQAMHFPNRSVNALRGRWLRYLDPNLGPVVPVHNVRKYPWTEEEDAFLRRSTKLGWTYSDMKRERLNHRSLDQIKTRIQHLVGIRPGSRSARSVSRVPEEQPEWTLDNDQLLWELVQQHGPSWDWIAAEFRRTTSKAHPSPLMNPVAISQRYWQIVTSLKPPLPVKVPHRDNVTSSDQPRLAAPSEKTHNPFEIPISITHLKAIVTTLGTIVAHVNQPIEGFSLPANGSAESPAMELVLHVGKGNLATVMAALGGKSEKGLQVQATMTIDTGLGYATDLDVAYGAAPARVEDGAEGSTVVDEGKPVEDKMQAVAVLEAAKAAKVPSLL